MYKCYIYFQKHTTTAAIQQQHQPQQHQHQPQSQPPQPPQPHQPHQHQPCDNILYNENNDIELYIDSNSRSSGDLADTELEANLRHHSRNFTLSPETTDYDSNCGDLDSLSNDINCTTDYGKLYTSMPVLEDGLSSGHASDTENNCQKYDSNGGGSGSNESVGLNEKLQQQQQQEMLEQNKYNSSLKQQECMDNNCSANNLITNLVDVDEVVVMSGLCIADDLKQQQQQQQQCIGIMNASENNCCNNDISSSPYEPIYATVNKQHHHQQSPPPPPAPQAHRPQQQQQSRNLKHPGRAESVEIQEAMKEIRSALQRAKTQPEKLKFCDEVLPPDPESPIWVPRKNTDECQASSLDIEGGGVVGVDSNKSHCDEEEPDTDLETDRLLGQQRNDEQDFFDDKVSTQ